MGYLTDVLTRIVNGHPNSDIDKLLPWAYRQPDLKPWPENDAYEEPQSGEKEATATDFQAAKYDQKLYWELIAEHNTREYQSKLGHESDESQG